MDGPDPLSLRCFLAAAEHLNFRLAAAQVALSPAAFSDRIQRLEAELGARLFERTTRSVALTAAGRRLLPQAEQALAAARGCYAVVSDDARPAPFELRLGTRFELGLSWLVPALSGLREACPERRIHLRFGDSPELLELLRARAIDALVSSVRLTQSGLSYATLHPESYVFVGAPALLGRAPLTGPADAAAHTLLDASPELPLFSYLLDMAPATTDWPFADTELLGTIAAIRLRVLSGAGVCVLPTYFVREDLAAGRLVQILPEYALREDAFRLIWRTGDSLQEELRALGAALTALPLR